MRISSPRLGQPISLRQLSEPTNQPNSPRSNTCQRGNNGFFYYCGRYV